MNLLPVLAAAAALAGAAACTLSPEADTASTQTAAGERQCFLPRSVNGFTAVDDDIVHVHVGASQVYRLELVGVCPDVDWSNRIGIRATGGGSWVCRGFDAELLVPGPLGVQTCPVTRVRRLSEAEVRSWRESRGR